MTHDQLLAAVGVGWRALVLPPPGTHVPVKFMDRPKSLVAKHALIHRHLAEYITGGLLVQPGSQAVDFSCGNGAFLEALRAYGHSVLGVEIQYLHFLESQQIPVVVHDCRSLPFPLPDQSADLVSCQGAITFYGEQPWGPILDEFARIARRTIFVVANNGHVLEGHRHEIEGWASRGWVRVQPIVGGNVFKWVRE